MGYFDKSTPNLLVVPGRAPLMTFEGQKAVSFYEK